MSGEREYRYPDGTVHVLPGNEHQVEYYRRKGFTLVEEEQVAAKVAGAKSVDAREQARDGGALGEGNPKGQAAPKEGKALKGQR